MFNKIKMFFSRCDFDLQHPIDKGIYKVYVCKKCGRSLALEHWQMIDLPLNMKVGCKGSVKIQGLGAIKKGGMI